MNVKCPKCRFKYDTQVAPGIQEVACVCPRCGTPFTYVVPDEEPGSAAGGGESAGRHLHTNPSEERESDFQQPHPEQTPPRLSQREGAQHPPIPPTSVSPPWGGTGRLSSPNTQPLSPNIYHPSPNPHHPSSPKGGSRLLKGCFGAAALVILILIVIVRGCSRDESYSGADVENSTEVANSDAVPVVSASDRVQAEREERAGKSPSWIQGNWVYHTDYGVISVKIHGSHIAETSGGETSYGTFTYENGHLNCDFGDGSIIVYKLDEEHQQIDCGEGMLMKRVE